MSMSVSRRHPLTGTVALGTVVYWLACGSSKSKVGGSAANNALEDILRNLQVNKQDRSSLKQGGTPDSRLPPWVRTSTYRPRAATPPATWTHWHPATFPP